jgi:hypothetical protein
MKERHPAEMRGVENRLFFSFLPIPKKLGQTKGSTVMYTPPKTESWPAPPQPPQNKRSLRTLLIWVLGIAFAIIVALGTMVAVSASSGTSQIGVSHAQSASPSAPAKKVHKPTMKEWLNGPGGDALYTVKDDLGQIGTDAGNYDLDATAEDGTQLADDAGLAKGLLPPDPEVAQHYRIAMNDFIKAGNLMSMGTLEGLQEATTWISKGTTQVAEATQALTP